MATLEPTEASDTPIGDPPAGVSPLLSPIIFSPAPSPSQTINSTLLYPESTPDGFETAPGFPEVYPIPVAPFLPPSSPAPLQLLQELSQELEAGVETGLLEGEAELDGLHHQIRREEHQSLIALISGLTHQTPHLSSLYFDSGHALAGARGVDGDGHYYQDFLLLHTYLVRPLPGGPAHGYDEFQGSAYVWFYPHPVQDAPQSHGPPPSGPAPSQNLSGNLDPAASSPLVDGVPSPSQDHPASPVQIVVQESLSEGPPHSSLLLQPNTPHPEPELLATGPICGASQVELTPPSNLPSAHPPDASDMPGIETGSCFYQPSSVSGEPISIPGFYNLTIHCTPTGWIAEITYSGEVHQSDSQTTIGTLVSTPEAVEVEEGEEGMEEIDVQTFLLLSDAIGYASATHHPPPFEAISYPDYPDPPPMPVTPYSHYNSIEHQLYHDIFGSGETELSTSEFRHLLVDTEDLECQIDQQVYGAYKHVDQKVKPVPGVYPEDAHVHCHFPSDPLRSLIPLSSHPPAFTPTKKLTKEQLDAMKINAKGFLWPEEEKLFCHIMKLNEAALAFDESERGNFCSDYFTPYIKPVLPHEPWEYCNIPIPPGI
ncbi:hypothetical protein EDC04DRAFT_2887395 [Pisolithus marmoratus]|nr:hypothetical protein EDC04DRAFT_2887395 [Pisolithus marmoratus]